MLITIPAAIDANSYLTLAGADAYAAGDIGKNARAWIAATTDQKEAALRRAAADLDAHVGRVSYRYDTGQRLLFPRMQDIDEDGLPVIPEPIGRAQYEQAAYLLVNADAIDDAASRRAMGLSNFSNPDGTGGSIATEPTDGLLAPRAARYIADYIGGSTIAWISTT